MLKKRKENIKDMEKLALTVGVSKKHCQTNFFLSAKEKQNGMI